MRGPPVPPGESTGLNQERPGQCAEACWAEEDGLRLRTVVLGATAHRASLMVGYSRDVAAGLVNLPSEWLVRMMGKLTRAVSEGE